MDPTELEVGELVSDVFLVSEAKLGTDRRGGQYYSLTVNCEGGRQVDAKVWSDNIGEPLEAGNAIEALARVDEYKGTLQFNIQRYEIIPPDEFDPAPYVRTADVDVDEGFETLFNWDREEFKNPFLKRLLCEFYNNESFAKQFKSSPAASHHHHNYTGGLVEHTLEMWELADRMCDQFGDKVDRELLLAGTTLHDVGKIKCYHLLSGVSERTDYGDLLDHIFISASMVSNLSDQIIADDAAGLGREEAGRQKAMVLHLILSHHGKKEWGSPVLPQCPEAILLHFCDQISATMRSCFDAIEAVPEGQERTDWLTIMDNARKLVVPPDASPGTSDMPEE